MAIYVFMRFPAFPVGVYICLYVFCCCLCVFIHINFYHFNITNVLMIFHIQHSYVDLKPSHLLNGVLFIFLGHTSVMTEFHSIEGTTRGEASSVIEERYNLVSGYYQ